MDKEQCKYEELDDNNYWRINICDYTTGYKKYFDENKIVMGLGSNLNLKEYIDSNKEVIHKNKSHIESFLEIKKGDYIEWILYNREEDEYGDDYLEVSKLLGKVTQELSEAYEFIEKIGHSLPVQVIEKSIIKKYNEDYVKLLKISNWNSYWVSYFEDLPGYEEMKEAEETKWYLNFRYFGLENIDYDEKEGKIKIKDFLSEEDKTSILKKLRALKKGDYVLGDFSSKNDKNTEAFRVIGTVAYEKNIDGNKELVLDVKGQNHGEGYISLINIYEQDSEETSINFINTKLRKNKNVILYGPPGTGKTYSISREIVKITNPHMIIEEADREEINKQVKELQIENRIKYCTFHQSYGYEEFIEGLRSDGEGNFVLEDGILKEIVIEALFNALAYECKAKLMDEIEDLEEEKEDLTEAEVKAKEKEIKTKKKEVVLKYINQGNRFDFYNCDQYVIVIDEINRGNISKVFGELITLLEEDKRLSRENEMLIKLPYSKEDFILPPNLHLIGTMNTSDKSIAPIDIALRRRFKFIERMPDAELLKTVDGVDLAKMLKKINDRIEYLYDRDHMIGHAYFINLQSLEEIIDTFSNKILPLLQEYFYEDWNKIGMVLGGIGTSEKDSYMIYKKNIKPEDLFKGTEAEGFCTISKYYIKDEIGQQEIKSIYE